MPRSEHSVPTLTPTQARQLHLAAQGLLHPPRRRARPADVVTAIERLRMLQIDTIHVVARSPYLVLFSRLGAYPQAWLDEALEAGRLVECWAHEACFVSASDYPWHVAARPLRDGHWAFKRAKRIRREHGKAVRHLLEQVRERGPVRAGDLAAEGPRKSGWWEWTFEKSGLEALFALGEVMVARRERFQRVYDLAERVMGRVRAAAELPETPDASTEAVRTRFAADAVRALGLARPGWIGDYHRQGTVPAGLLETLVERGELFPVRVRGWDEAALVHRDHAALLRRIAAGRVRATRSTLLSPFDPVVWDRARARELFGFDYALECYTPSHKRRYGYFVLPLLHCGRLIARVDAKAHRRDGVFEVRALYMERDRSPAGPELRGIAHALQDCADWHGTPHVRVGSCGPAGIKRGLVAALASE